MKLPSLAIPAAVLIVAGATIVAFAWGQGGGEPAGAMQVDVDTDGDGFMDDVEAHVGTDPLAHCGVGSGYPQPSYAWPADLDESGFPLFSQDRVDIMDVVSYLSPRRLDTDPGDNEFDQRWDLRPGKGMFMNTINLSDLVSMLTLAPPMFGGAKAWNGPTCTAHPVYGD